MPTDPKLYQMLLDAFKEELHELHHCLIEDLLKLEKDSSEHTRELLLKDLFRYSHNIKGSAASASIKVVSELAHHLENLFSEWKKSKQRPEPQIISACLEVADNLLIAFEKHCEGELIDTATYLAPLKQELPTHHHSEQSTSTHYLKLPLARIERVSAKANEFIPYQLKLTHWHKEINHILKKLTQSMNDSSQILSLSSRLATLSNESGQFLEEFTRSIHALQDEIKTMRMIPISILLVPLARTARNIAAELNKSINLEIIGGHVELDKTIIDGIRDPILHLIRNAIDHGIESDAIRQKHHKPIPAQLTIRITHISAKIKIELSDDGAGIDTKKIKQTLLASQLYTSDEVNQLSQTELLNCLFISGFSTKTKVTELSGRGVGLDIVKNSLQKINGTVSLETHIDKGTCFTLTVPLTLATTRGVCFCIKNQKLIVPSIAITMLYTIKPNQWHTVDNQYVVTIDKEPVVIKFLSQILKMNEAAIDLSKTYDAILMKQENEKILFLVDQVLDEHDYLVKPLPHPYTQLDYYIGVALSGENDIALVLDPVKIMNMALDSSHFKPLPINAHKKISHKKRILIVDDSLTSRTLCVNAVITAGYEASSAIDGQKAWHLIQEEHFDCVITDILMPEMNGWELTQRIKQNKKYNHIPVIIITSLDSKEDKQHGLEAGANAFVVKNEFDTLNLIQIMESLI